MTTQTNITLLGESYGINVEDGDVETLKQSAKLFEKHLQEMQKQSNLISSDKIALMAGLNMAREFLSKSSNEGDIRQASETIQQLSHKIEQELDRFLPDHMRQKTLI